MAKAASAKKILEKAAALAKRIETDDSSGSSSAEESSSGESDNSEEASPPVKLTPTTVKKTTGSSESDDSSDTSSSEESSSEESDSDNKGKAPVRTAPAAVQKTADVSDNSSGTSSSEGSLSEDSESDDEKTAKKAPNSKDKSSDASSSEESSGSDSDEEEETSAPLQITPVDANKKRKAGGEAAAPPKKAKLANGSADVATSGDESRSIFVGRLSWNVDNDWLAEEFAECGEVESAHVQMDRNTGRSRGFGYVHFKTADAVEKALALNGREIDGRPVNIDRSNQPDKKASIEKRAQAFGDTPSSPSAVLFVGNLSFGVNEDTLWETFGEHGDVKSVRVPTDRDTGKPKGFAYVEFSEVGAAKKAHGALQGYEFDGRSIRLDFSQPRDSAGDRGGGRGGRGGRGRGGFGGDRGGFGGGRGGFGGNRGRGAGRGARGGDRGGRGRGRGARTGGITQFEGQKITF